MQAPDTETYRQPLLIEQLAKLFRFNRLSDAIPGQTGNTLYLFYGFWVGFDIFVLNGYRHLSGGKHAFFVDPFWTMIPVGIILATVSVNYMANGYAEAVSQLRVNHRLDGTQDHRVFERPISMRVKLGVYAVALVLFFWNALFNIGLSTLFAIEGVIPALVANFFLIPVIYLPLMVEFVLLYFSIHILLPRRIHRADIGLFFYDPRNMGGFAPIGQLLKRTYYIYTLGLLLYFTLTYGSTIVSAIVQSPYPDPGLAAAVFFSTAWVVGLGSMAYSMYTIHTVMAREKEERIRSLEQRIHEAIDDPYDIEESEVVDREKLEDSRNRLEEVRATKEYPTTFTMWSQIIISAFIPQALNMAVQFGA